MATSVSSKAVPVSSPAQTALGAACLLVEGVDCGPVQSIHGGELTAEVNTTNGPGSFPKKSVTNIKFMPIELQIGFGMGQPLRRWIEKPMGALEVKDGTVVMPDSKGEPRYFLTFQQAYINEIGLPELDETASDEGFLSLKLRPEVIKIGQKEQCGYTQLDPKRRFVRSKFKLTLQDLDCTRVAKIDAFTLEQSLKDDAVGTSREPLLGDRSVVIPDLTLTFRDAQAGDSWIKWYKSWFIEGNHLEKDLKNGELLLLSDDGARTLCKVELTGVGLYSYTGPEC
ncbi:MAG TPA: hypothetical protein VLW85_19140, partial [Myxococcales bacterium]|nr:hypothetical protein [Myxococcales bacterium]